MNNNIVWVAIFALGGIECSAYTNFKQELGFWTSKIMDTDKQRKILSLRDFYVENAGFEFYSRSRFEESRSSIFNRSFFKNFIKKSFNHDEFASVAARETWPICDILELLEELNVTSTDVMGILRLLSNKIIFCSEMKPEVHNRILSTLVSILKPHFKHHKEKNKIMNSMRKNIQRMIVDRLTSDFPSMQQDPESFANDLSGCITVFVESVEETDLISKVADEITMERFRSVIVQFIQSLLASVSWDDIDHATRMVDAGNYIVTIMKKKIINDLDEIDSLLWSLTAGIVRSLKNMPTTVLDELMLKITNNEVPFLELAEQCLDVASKKDLILQTIQDVKNERTLTDSSSFRL